MTPEHRAHVEALVEGDLAALAERYAAAQRQIADLLASLGENMAALAEVRALWRELRER